MNQNNNFTIISLASGAWFWQYSSPSAGLQTHASAGVSLSEGDTLSKLIFNIVRTVQQLLFLGRARDLPSIFCVMFLLGLIHGNLRRVAEYTGVGAFNEMYQARLGEVFKTISKLFSFCMGALNPLSGNWNQAIFERLVGERGIAEVEVFIAINDVWIREGSVSPDEDQLINN